MKTNCRAVKVPVGFSDPSFNSAYLFENKKSLYSEKNFWWGGGEQTVYHDGGPKMLLLSFPQKQFEIFKRKFGKFYLEVIAPRSWAWYEM